MGLFYKAPLKERMHARVDIFVKSGIPALQRNGFVQSPYFGARTGKYDGAGRVYDFCRLTENSQLETITAYISLKDRYIQIFLNVVELRPTPDSVEQLRGLDITAFFSLRKTWMRLRMNDFKGMPLFRTVEHKVKRYFTQWGYGKRVAQLNKLIGDDLANIDSFVARWHELHQPPVTDWEGNLLGNKS